MRKKFLLSAFIGTVILMAIIGCGKTEENDVKESSETIKQEDVASGVVQSTQSLDLNEEKEDNEENKANEEILSLFESLTNYEFYHSSGAGAWMSSLEVDNDLSFTGSYYDTDMGTTGEGYHYGTQYSCEFTGMFTEIKKENEYCYSMYISEVQFEHEPDTQVIEDGMRILYVDEWGGEEGEKVYLYLPGMPMSELPEDALVWFMGSGSEESETLTSPSFCMSKENRCFVGYEKFPEGTDDEVNTDIALYVSETLENPSWDYYCAAGLSELTVNKPTFQLVETSSKKNEIIDTDAYFAELDIPEPSIPYADEQYSYSKWGVWESDYDSYILSLYRFDDCARIEYDFSAFTYAPDSVQADIGFVFQRIGYAMVRDNVLYVSIGHNTYANSASHNAYLMAIDIETNEILWKTEPLTCNSHNFEIIDDFLVCGYGFTEEPDFVKVVDRKTGVVVQEIPVKSKPDYLTVIDDELYVRCYNTDYVYSIVR